jgi:FMN-dependent NADH-azoreductase
MSTLLYLKASSRKVRSRSSAVADAFLETYRQVRPEDAVVTIDLFDFDLPVLDEETLDAKYAILNALPADSQKHGRWQRVEGVIAQFKAADLYLLAVPMWNFGIPYRLKHFFDVIVQPSYTFAYDSETGYKGLVTGKPAVVVYARGGDYSGRMADYDLQRPYMQTILKFIGFQDIREVLVGPTVTGSPRQADQIVEKAKQQARELARTF